MNEIDMMIKDLGNKTIIGVSSNKDKRKNKEAYFLEIHRWANNPLRFYIKDSEYKHYAELIRVTNKLRKKKNDELREKRKISYKKNKS